MGVGHDPLDQQVPVLVYKCRHYTMVNKGLSYRRETALQGAL